MKRILVIDDHPEAADLLVSILELEGHQAQAAYGGLAGLQAVAEFGPDIVFLDIGMPDLNGFEVAARIRRDARLHQPYLIAFTALSDATTIAKAGATGFNCHVAKTSTFEVLMDAIKNVSQQEMPPRPPLANGARAPN